MKIEEKKNTPTFKTAEVVTLVIITCIVSLLMGIIISKTNESQKYELIEADAEIQNFIEQYNYIVENYYGEVDKKELLEAALEGMIDSLGDPYSSYIDESTSSTFNATLNGSYEGIGVEITNDADKNIIITQVFENTPASAAGIKPLDIIISVNDKQVSNTTTSDFITMVKEIDNDTFTLGLKRGEENITVTVSRKKVTLSSVSSEIIEQSNQKIGYIYVSIFAMNTDSQFKTQLRKLETEEINSLIIDLRGNSGGHLTAVENMINEFLDSTNVIYQIETKSEIIKYYSKGKETKKYPIILLVDEDSASASEMMAAALKESYGATIVGKTTYGKGTVQELQDNNESQYKITTKKWLTPNGIWINEVGVKPDYEVELDNNYFLEPIKDNDNQLQKAIDLLKNGAVY